MKIALRIAAFPEQQRPSDPGAKVILTGLPKDWDVLHDNTNSKTIQQ